MPKDQKLIRWEYATTKYFNDLDTMGLQRWECFTKENDYFYLKRPIVDIVKEEKKERWKPNVDDVFFYIHPFLYVDSFHWKSNEYNESLWSIGNVFQTREEAEAYKPKMIAKLKELIEE